MKQQRKALAVGILSALCLCLTAQKVTATESIDRVSIKVSMNIEAGDRLPNIQINKTDGECYVNSGDKKYTIREAEWVTSTSKDMTIGEEPKMNVTLTPSDEYDAYFKSNYEASKIKISGGSYVSAKRSGSDLVVTLRAKAIKGLYAEPEDIGWKDTRLGQAVWSKGDNTSGAYEIWLYLGKKVIFKKEQVKATTYNFYPYMTEEGTYSFKIRSVPFKADELKNGKKSGWVESDELVIRDRDVSDGTGKESDTTAGTTANPEKKTGWEEQSGVWYYRYADGSVQANSWLMLDDVYYRFDQNGKMITGWFVSDSDIYYMDSKGAMVKGWNKIDNSWYYFYPDNGYEAPMGAAATGWQIVDGYYHYFNNQGAMQKGWINQAGRWYYLNTIQGNLEGAMLKGLFTRDGKTYYIGEDGVMLTGWQKVDGVWRYFNQQDGVMAVSTVIDGYHIDEDGVWQQ